MYGFNLGETGLAFLCVVVTTVIGGIGYTIYQRKVFQPRIAKEGMPPIEEYLTPAIPASILMPIGLFVFAWTARPSIHWFVSLIGCGIYSLGLYLLIQCVLLYVPLIVSPRPSMIDALDCPFMTITPLFASSTRNTAPRSWPPTISVDPRWPLASSSPAGRFSYSSASEAVFLFWLD